MSVTQNDSMIESLRTQNVELGQRLSDVSERARELENQNHQLRLELEGFRLKTQLKDPNKHSSAATNDSKNQEQVQLLKALLLVQNVDVENRVDGDQHGKSSAGTTTTKKILLSTDAIHLLETMKQVRVLRHTLYILRAQVVQLQLSIPQTANWVARSVENAVMRR